MAAAAAAMELTWTTDLFWPTNRFRDRIREMRVGDSYELSNGRTEVELFPDLSPQHVLATGITWEDFCGLFLRGKIIWMGPNVYVCARKISHHGIYPFIVELGSSNRQGPSLRIYATIETTAATTATCDFVVRLLATSAEGGAL
jgi:hypothetical protein